MSFRMALMLGFMLPMLGAALAQSPEKTALKVAVYAVAPYVSTGSGNEIDGHSVRLLTLVARELDRKFELTRVERIDAIFAGLNAGAYDLAIGALTVTPAREAIVDFSHPTHPSGVAVATRRVAGLTSALDALRATFVELLPLLLLMAGLIVVAGVTAWWLERRVVRSSTPERTHIASPGDGVYWAAVTMTTVGYGDKTPKSVLTKLLTIVWMFVGLIVISIFTGSVTAKLTSTQIGIANGAETAFRFRSLAAVKDSSGAEFLVGRGTPFTSFASLPEALAALDAGKVDAVFNSRGALVHHVVTGFPGSLEVLSNDLTHGWMAFALPNGSPNIEPLNRAILKVLVSPVWAAERERMAQEYSVQGKPERTTF
ncbi:HisJ ABC-type amino acid transport/signal transduction systems, periplasmic component/domain [Rhabdaerophilaceae bacterium]